MMYVSGNLIVLTLVILEALLQFESGSNEGFSTSYSELSSNKILIKKPKKQYIKKLKYKQHSIKIEEFAYLYKVKELEKIKAIHQA